jgi:hypothetical protein
MLPIARLSFVTHTVSPDLGIRGRPKMRGWVRDPNPTIPIPIPSCIYYGVKRLTWPSHYPDINYA